jgi:hypothetical protein
MKYETPRLTASTNAINAVQGTKDPHETGEIATPYFLELVGAYADWE